MPGDVVVDIGANRGWFRDYAYSLCPGLKFIAFEPQARYRQRLERPDTKAYSLALGASDGTATLHLVNDSDGGNTGSLVLELQAPEVETVPVARLDSFTEDIDRIHTIKIDVDGGEIDLVRGGIKTISKAQYVICEVLNEGNLEVLKQLLPGWSFQRTSDTDYIGRNSTYAK